MKRRESLAEYKMIIKSYATWSETYITLSQDTAITLWNRWNTVLLQPDSQIIQAFKLFYLWILVSSNSPHIKRQNFPFLIFERLTKHRHVRSLIDFEISNEENWPQFSSNSSMCGLLHFHPPYFRVRFLGSYRVDDCCSVNGKRRNSWICKNRKDKEWNRTTTSK